MSNPTKSLADLGLRGLVLVWGYPQGTRRSKFLAQALGMDLKYVYLTRKQGIFYAPIKYPVQAVETLVVLVRRRPQVVLAQNPPIFAALVAYVWALVTGAKFMIDSHTDALQASWWTWSLPLQRFLARRAITTIVTNDHLKEQVTAWNAPAFVLTDVPVISIEQRQVHLDETQFNIVVVSTASYDEPIAQILEAAARMPEVTFYITGNYAARQDVIATAPGNVRFTGYVPDNEFYGLLGAAQTIMCLTTENHTIQSGAGEALWLGRPIITSDWPLLREYFCKGTIYVNNTAESIQQAVMKMRDNLQSFEAEIQALQANRRQEWLDKTNTLMALIQQATGTGPAGKWD